MTLPSLETSGPYFQDSSHSHLALLAKLNALKYARLHHTCGFKEDWRPTLARDQ